MNKYYFLTDFISREDFLRLRKDFENYRESIGKYSENWGPGELENFAYEKGLITLKQYENITKSLLM